LEKPKLSDSMNPTKSSKRYDCPRDSQYFENEARNTMECGCPDVIGIAGMASLKVLATTYLKLVLSFDSLSNILNIL